MTEAVIETWLPVVGHPWWEVSSEGRVRSPRGVLTPRPDRNGYMRLDLGRQWRGFVHHLVLGTFVGPCPEGMETRHLDDDKSNNALTNLRWGTKSANTYDRISNGRHVQARKTHCPKGHPYDEANTYRKPSGARACRACRAAARPGRIIDRP